MAEKHRREMGPPHCDSDSSFGLKRFSEVEPGEMKQDPIGKNRAAVKDDCGPGETSPEICEGEAQGMKAG